jgi:hypothetical protein
VTTTQGEASVATGSFAGGAAAVLVALVYGVVGPLIGAMLLAPLGALFKGEEMPYALLGGLLLLIDTFPTSAAIAYYSAGLVALCTGIVVAVAARRRGTVPLQVAVMAAVAVVLSFSLVAQFTGYAPPGAIALRGRNAGGVAIVLVTSIVASLACCLLTRPLQKRSR